MYVDKNKPVIVYTTGEFSEKGNPIVLLHKGFQTFALESFDNYEEVTNEVIKNEMISFHNEVIREAISEAIKRKKEYDDFERILLVMENALILDN